MDWNGIQRKLQEDARQREEDQRRARQQGSLNREKLMWQILIFEKYIFLRLRT